MVAIVVLGLVLLLFAVVVTSLSPEVAVSVPVSVAAGIAGLLLTDSVIVVVLV